MVTRGHHADRGASLSLMTETPPLAPSSKDWEAAFKPNEKEQLLLDLLGVSSCYVSNLSWDLLPDQDTRKDNDSSAR